MQQDGLSVFGTCYCTYMGDPGVCGCLYVPAFPAWALSRVLPGNGPVVALVSGRAAVWSRVPALKEVRPGDRPDRILRLCPEARVHARDASVEDAAWDDVLQRLHGVTPFVAPSGPPFATFRVDSGVVVDSTRGLGPVRKDDSGARASGARTDGREWADPAGALSTLVRDLGIRVGLGADRSMARLAAVRAADRHVLAVPADRRRSFLSRFSVDFLVELGYPERLPAQLRLFGYQVLGSLESLTRRHLEGQFGKDGVTLHALLHPPPVAPVGLYVLPPNRVASFEPEEAIDPGAVAPVLRMLARQAAQELGELRSQRLVIELHVARRPDPRTAGRLLPEPHRDPETLARFAIRLLDETVEAGDRVERVVLRLEALRRPTVTQASLFDLRPALLGAVRRVHRRYPEAIRRAVCRPDALFPEEDLLFESFERPG